MNAPAADGAPGTPGQGSDNGGPDDPVPHHIVGIGASAGGLEALERLFAAMPIHTGMAFVVVQHLSPDFKSLMPELLERHTSMQVVPVSADQQLQPDTVYVLTAGLTLTVSGQRLQVQPRGGPAGHHLPINRLFESMASLGPRAVAVVLSGTGTDATAGVQAVHAAGGLVLAQLPATARFDSMPRSAMESGSVDIVCDPAEMPRAIAGWLADPVHGRQFGASGPTGQGDAGDAHGRILALLHAAFEIDFEHYKPGTIVRRIERRLKAGPAPITAETYADRLAKSRTELDALFSDLLIGVTRFFRDEAAWAALAQQALGPMIDALGAKDELRLWSCGCSTGEEAYSLAMQALEAFEARGRVPRLRILATDLHGASLQVASQGVYSAEALAAVPAAWREKYFVPQPTGLYKVSDDLRRVVIFSAHNLLRDAAFTRIDVVSCRNLLIYLQPPAQTRALAAFHFALRPGGMLFLGESEGTGELHEAFEPADREARLFRKAPGVQLPTEMRASLTSLVPARQVSTSLDTKATHRLNELLLQRYLPAGLLVNQQHQVLHLYGDAGRYLQPSAGRFRGDLATLLGGPLRSAVFMALRKAAQTRESVSFGDILDDSRGRGEKLRVIVDPITDRSLPQVYFMVRLVSDALAEAMPPALEMHLPGGTHLALQVEELEGELNRVREALQHTVEELEAANEELQAGNEELMASNEELQSTNEELHAVNEELYSVNAEHELKIQELRAATADMNNLIRATELPILFLDSEVRLRMFTPAAGELFPLRPGDIGRDLRDFMPREADQHLVADIATALAEPQVIDRELTLADGRCLRRRLTPYRDNSQRANGLVLTYVDVSLYVRLQEAGERHEALREAMAALDSVFAASPSAMLVIAVAGEILRSNPAAEQLLGYSNHALAQMTVEDLVPPAMRQRHRLMRTGYMEHPRPRPMGTHATFPLVRGDGSIVEMDIQLSPIQYAGRPVVVAALRDLRSAGTPMPPADAALQARGNFLANMSHEIRTPLNAILGMAQLLELDDPSPQQLDRLKRIEEASKHLLGIVNDILDLAKIEAGRVVLDPVVFDPAEVLERSIAMVADRAAIKRLEIRPHLAKEAAGRRLGDARRIEQILVNYLTNAVKFTPSGHIDVSFSHQAGADGTTGWLRVEVADTGIGIDEAQLKRLFMPFQQADDGNARRYGGTGLGLAISRHLARAMGGDCGVTSSPGRGSTFWFTAQAAPVLAVAAAPPARASDDLAEHRRRLHARCMGRHILVVEDDAVNRIIVTELIRSVCGVQAEVAEGGEQALRSLERQRADLILMDMQMPGVDGLEATRRIRAMPGMASIPIVALTASVMADDVAQCIAAGMSGHLGKPLMAHDLARVIDHWLPELPGAPMQAAAD